MPSTVSNAGPTQATGIAHWRTITPENVTAVYGLTEDSRIADPGNPARVYSWLICETYDDKGNVMRYECEAENGANVDLTQVSEANRAWSANRYPKRIRYGNRVSRLVQPDLDQAEWLFEVVLDYDEGHVLPAEPGSAPFGADRRVLASASPARPWSVRPDPFSTHRPGFEVRTYRRCHRILMFRRCRPRRLRGGRHRLPRARFGDALLQPVGQRLERSAAAAIVPPARRPVPGPKAGCTCAPANSTI